MGVSKEPCEHAYSISIDEYEAGLKDPIGARLWAGYFWQTDGSGRYRVARYDSVAPGGFFDLARPVWRGRSFWDRLFRRKP